MLYYMKKDKPLWFPWFVCLDHQPSHKLNQEPSQPSWDWQVDPPKHVHILYINKIPKKYNIMLSWNLKMIILHIPVLTSKKVC